MIDNKNKIVNLNLHNKTDRVLDFSDFQKQTIQFDIDKLQDAYNQIIQIKKFDDGGGVTNFGAISLTQTGLRRFLAPSPFEITFQIDFGKV